MTTLLDRQLIFSYVKSYLVCLVSMLSLFIIVDLFTNLEGLSENHRGLANFLSFVPGTIPYDTGQSPRITPARSR